MKVEVRLFASLSKYTPEGLGDGETDVPEGCTAGELLERLGVPADLVKVVFVNGVHAPPERELQAGDRVGIFPPVAGG